MENNPFNLLGKKILVTGASSGIGKSVAIECSKMGADLTITGRCAERTNETFGELRGNNNKVIITDINEKGGISKIVDSIESIDGIVHCAGITKYLPFEFATGPDMEAVMRTNFFSPYELTRCLVEKNKVGKSGSVVFISSISGVLCSARASSIYSSSKGALNGAIKGIALDLAGKGIRVNSINPGVIETSIFSDGILTEEQLENDMKKYPLKRFGKPEEVAYAVIYLLSDASSWVTGSNMIIDGGFTLL